MDVAAWLRGLGLEQYAQLFHDNDIDGEILCGMNAEDLKELGVGSFGHRRRLFNAIAVLGGDPRRVMWLNRQRARHPLPPHRHQSTAERRQLTVMFCDLVGSTALSARLDPEDLREVIAAYQRAVGDVVRSFAGFVARYMGDGVLIYFGYPRADENDAERAVRAALAIQQSLGELTSGNAASGMPELVARIGLETGSVVVDATGEIFGEAPNIAARVQAAAEPGTVLVTSTVQRQVAGLFIVEDRGAHELRGAPAPVTLYRILRVSGGRRKKGHRLLTPFVGRAEDIGMVDRRWARARRGEGQFVLIVGEPGIGKSRLVEEFRARIGETPHSWVEWSSSQLLRNTPLHPVIGWGRVRFGGPEVPSDRRFAELELVLTQVKLDAKEHAALLAPLVDIPVPPERLPSLSPEAVRRRQLTVMVEWAIAGARIQPLVLVLEDLQWFDPTSIDLVYALSDRNALAPLLILATSRPEFRLPWSLRPHHSVVSLTPLDEAHVQRVVTELASNRALSPEVIRGVTERAGGVPLFAEELTRLVLECGEAGGTKAIPPTLRQSLAARLDRLGSAREVAQIGAVLGRTFPFALLRDVASLAVVDDGAARHSGAGPRGLDECGLHSALDSLLDADLLFVEGVLPQATYRFKHALIQDAAYESLLKSRRQALHRRAGEALVKFGGEAEAIAHHFTAAGDDDLAIEWCGQGGGRGSAPFGLQGGNLPSRQSHCYGGQSGRVEHHSGRLETRLFQTGA